VGPSILAYPQGHVNKLFITSVSTPGATAASNCLNRGRRRKFFGEDSSGYTNRRLRLCESSQQAHCKVSGANIRTRMLGKAHNGACCRTFFDYTARPARHMTSLIFCRRSCWLHDLLDSVANSIRRIASSMADLSGDIASAVPDFSSYIPSSMTDCSTRLFNVSTT